VTDSRPQSPDTLRATHPANPQAAAGPPRPRSPVPPDRTARATHRDVSPGSCRSAVRATPAHGQTADPPRGANPRERWVGELADPRLSQLADPLSGRPERPALTPETCVRPRPAPPGSPREVGRRPDGPTLAGPPTSSPVFRRQAPLRFRRRLVARAPARFPGHLPLAAPASTVTVPTRGPGGKRIRGKWLEVTTGLGRRGTRRPASAALADICGVISRCHPAARSATPGCTRTGGSRLRPGHGG
jgi:hypothetical protein